MGILLVLWDHSTRQERNLLEGLMGTKAKCWLLLQRELSAKIQQRKDGEDTS